jgi:hypothetical protein
MLLLWGSLAHAATLIIQFSGPVKLQVDGVFLEGNGGTATAHDLDAGSHTVRVVDMMSKPLLTQEVVLAANDYVVMKYKAKTLTETNRSREDDSAPTAEPTAQFDLLLTHVKGCETAQGQLDVIRLAADLWTFSTNQAVQLMATFDKETDKVEVVKVLRKRLVDPEHGDVVVAAVTGAEAKVEIKALFD